MSNVHRPDDTEMRMTSPRNPAEGSAPKLKHIAKEMFMAISSKVALVRMEDVSQPWLKLRPAKSFAGLTYEQFLITLKPSYDVRAEIAELEVRLQSARARLVTVDEQSLNVVQRVVNAVKADPEEGDDGELYVAMGYVRKRDRKTGLTQRKREVKIAEAHPSGAQKEAAAQ